MKQSAGRVTADKLEKKYYDLLNEARIDKDKRTGTGTGDQLWALLPTQ